LPLARDLPSGPNGLCIDVPAAVSQRKQRQSLLALCISDAGLHGAGFARSGPAAPSGNAPLQVEPKHTESLAHLCSHLMSSPRTDWNGILSNDRLGFL
jgi:hypothetical protein